MSRAIMQAQIEAEQDRAEAQWEACMQREAEALARQEAEEAQYADDWKKYDHVDHFAAADYYDEIARSQ